MSSGYDKREGAPSLVCGEGAPLSPQLPSTCVQDNLVNFVSLGMILGGSWIMRGWNGAALIPVQSALYAQTQDWSFEAWVHPRLGVPNYGAAVPNGTGVIDADAASCPFALIGSQTDYFIHFRDGHGICIGNRDDIALVYTQVATGAFPTDMNQWFHIVCNIYNSGGSQNMSLWVNGEYIGTVATTIAAAAQFYTPLPRAGTGNNHVEMVPVLGACACHGRQMTAAEIRATYLSKTCAVLGDDTWFCMDAKDVYFTGGSTCLMPPLWAAPPAVAWSEYADAYLGNGVCGGSSIMTFSGTNMDGLVAGGAWGVHAWLLERSGNYPNIIGDAVTGPLTQYANRYGYFDGR